MMKLICIYNPVDQATIDHEKIGITVNNLTDVVTWWPCEAEKPGHMGLLFDSMVESYLRDLGSHDVPGGLNDWLAHLPD